MEQIELKPCPFCGGPSQNWKEDAANDWNDRAEIYITHPVTEEPLDKSQCKRIITQMYAEIRYLKEQLACSKG